MQQAVPNPGKDIVVDVRLLVEYIKSRRWMLLAIVFLVETLIWLAGSLATESYKTDTLIRLGRLMDVDTPGTQGVVAKIIERELVGTAVKVVQRPNGTLMITAEGGSPEQAVALAQKARDLAINASRRVLDNALDQHRERARVIQESIDQVESEIQALLPKRQGKQYQSEIAKLANFNALGQLTSLRVQLRGDLARHKVNVAGNTVSPAVLSEPVAPTRPFRPQRLRNAILGLIFGAPFALLVLALMGVYRQVASIDRSGFNGEA